LGLVSVSGQVQTRAGFRVEAEQVLSLAPLVLPDAESAADPLEIYRDEWLAVLDKPAGLRMHGNYIADPHPSVARFVEEKYGPGLPTNQGAERPGIVHRLDRGTSGVCVVAFDQQVFLDLQQQFRDREVEKEYRALCYGKPRFQSDWIESRLIRDSKRPERMRITRSHAPESRDALTYWEHEEVYQGFCRILCKPRTGRMHQIRVHLASIDLPIVGDPLYRAKNYGLGMHPEDAPTIDRPLLHACRLTLEHPVNGERMQFDSELAEDLLSFQRSLKSIPPPEEEGWK